MTTLLILHSSVDGQTKKICRSIANQIQKVVPAALVLEKTVGGCTLKDLQHSDIVILGASIRYGKHRNTVYQFVEQYRDQLDAKISCFFSVNLVARKAGKDTADTNPYLAKFLKQTQWQPKQVDVFAGKIDYARYGLFDTLMIKLIMWMTKGPTRSNQPIEFTDWQRVQTFTNHIISHIKADEAPLAQSEIQVKQDPHAEIERHIKPEIKTSYTTLNSSSYTAHHTPKSQSQNQSQNASENHFTRQINAQNTPTDHVLIVCGHCDTTNRIPSAKITENPSCGQCKQPIFSTQPIALHDNISKHIQTNQVLTVVDFWASWCQPCHQMAPQFAHASKQLPQVVFAKLQTDKFKHASEPYQVRSLPTLVAFKNGVEISRQSGVMSTGQIVKWVNSLEGV